MKRMARALISVFLLALFLPALAAAQAGSTAQIAGTVKDDTGGVLPGVTVTVTQTATSFTRTAVSDETGGYVLPNLPVGPYRLEATLQRVRSYVQTGIVLAVNGTPTGKGGLPVGAVSAQNSVEGDPARGET